MAYWSHGIGLIKCVYEKEASASPKGVKKNHCNDTKVLFEKEINGK